MDEMRTINTESSSDNDEDHVRISSIISVSIFYLNSGPMKMLIQQKRLHIKFSLIYNPN